MNWAYGVTTVPARLYDLLPKTLDSLEAAGFGEPRIFLDGASHYPDDCKDRYARYATTFRYPAVLTFGNWILSLWELYLRNPRADRFAVFQDDLAACRSLRSFLETEEWHPKTYLNLYTTPENAEEIRGKVGWHPARLRGKGALALVFDRDALWQVLGGSHIITRPLVSGRRVREFPLGCKGVDGAVVDSMHNVGWTEVIHWPSLVQHTGMESVSANRFRPLSDSFPGEDFDAEAFRETR